jgi:hypothetical protein
VGTVGPVCGRPQGDLSAAGGDRAALRYAFLPAARLGPGLDVVAYPPGTPWR